MTETTRLVFVNAPPLPDMTANHEATSGMGGLLPGSGGFAYPPHLIAACLAEARAAGYEAICLDGARSLPAPFARQVVGTPGSILVIHVSVGTAEADLNFLRLLRALYRGRRAPKLLLTGPSAHLASAGWVEEGLADAVLLGEPELALPAALDAVLDGARGNLAAGELAPDAYLPGNLMADLDGTAFPAWDAVPWQPYGMATLLSSRGCGAGCRFCAYAPAQGLVTRSQSVDRTLAEWVWLASDVGLPRLVLRDVVFAQDRERVAALCEGLLRRMAPPHGRAAPWECESRPEHFDRGLLALMKRAGCTTVKIGMESGDGAFLAQLGRVRDSSAAAGYLAQVQRVAEWCRELELRCRVFVMAGLPGQSAASIEQTRVALGRLPASAQIDANAYRSFSGLALDGPSQPVSAALLEGLRTANRPAPPLYRRALSRAKRTLSGARAQSDKVPTPARPRGADASERGVPLAEQARPYPLAGSRVFLTGGSGFIGGYVARALIEAGADVLALLRPGSDPGMLADLPSVTIVPGDLAAPAGWRDALVGCRACFHVAALYAGPDRAAEMTAVNVRATGALLAACVEAGVGRFIHTSTIGTVGRTPAPALPDESTPFNLWDQSSHYVRSKYLGELLARSWSDAGIEVVVVKPTAPVGAGDRRPTASGRRILAALQGTPLPYPPGGINHAPVVDIAAGHLLAAERGAAGETYILGHCQGNLDEAAFLRLVTGPRGARPPGARQHRPPRQPGREPGEGGRAARNATVGSPLGVCRISRVVSQADARGRTWLTGRRPAVSLHRRWIEFWLARGGLSRGGRLATRLASLGAASYKGKRALAQMNRRGYVSPRAQITCRDLRLGNHCYVDDEVVVFDRGDGGQLVLGDGVHLYKGTIIELGQGGCVEIGPNTHVQPNCQFTAYVGAIRIGRDVQIAPACAFYPYEHGIAAGPADYETAASHPRRHRDRRRRMAGLWRDRPGRRDHWRGCRDRRGRSRHP